MDTSKENLTSTSIVLKPKKDSSKISPLGISRYGRTRKPKISQDFCSIDDVIDNADEEISLKAVKPPTKTPKLKPIQTNIHANHVPSKEPPTKPKHRTSHNNNSEIMHITGDSDVTYDFTGKPNESSKQSRKFFKTATEEPTLPIVKNLYVTKEKIPEIKDKKLSEELKPILSEEIFQNPSVPSINVSEVFKIISNKSNEVEIEAGMKQNSKYVVKTYTNKRKSFQRQPVLIESFGLPDEPIVPISDEDIVTPLRISEIDVEVTKPENVNLINRELIDSLWKISSVDEDYICEENSIVACNTIFDVRSKFDVIEDNLNKNVNNSKTISNEENETKIISTENYVNTNKKNQSSKILRLYTDENIISHLSQNDRGEQPVVIKKIINTNADIKSSKKKENNSPIFLPISSPPSLTSDKEKINQKSRNKNFLGSSELTGSPKKGTCALVYKRDDNELNETKRPPIEICDIEDHLKVALIDKLQKKDVTDADTPIIDVGNNIDINKLKNQINSRMEMIKTEEEVSISKDEIKKEIIAGNIEEVINNVVGKHIKSPTEEIIEDKDAAEKATERDCKSPVKESLVEKEISRNRKDKSGAASVAKKDDSGYGLGDIMWARFGRFPYWPCLITKDPLTNEFQREKYGRTMAYHVRFFGDNGRRSWITNKNLLPYDTDLQKIKKEYKNEIIMPLPTAKSYIQWTIGVEEANGLKAKQKNQKLAFFSQMLAKKRLVKKRKVPKETVEKLSEAIPQKVQRGEVITARRRHTKSMSEIELKKVIIKSLEKALVEENIFRRITRSSLQKRKSLKSFYTEDKASEIDDIYMTDDDSKKHDSCSNSSDDEIESLTVESQAALYKRNNLFKGVPKERVCQICEQPDGVIKCKGRCNGYYHIACANKKEEPNTSNTNSVHDISADLQEIQFVSVADEDAIRKQIATVKDGDNTNEDNKPAIEYVSFNDENTLENEKFHEIAVLEESTGMKILPDQQEAIKEKDIPTRRRRRTRASASQDHEDNTWLTNRRITRSRSQEPESRRRVDAESPTEFRMHFRHTPGRSTARNGKGFQKESKFRANKAENLNKRRVTRSLQKSNVDGENSTIDGITGILIDELVIKAPYIKPEITRGSNVKIVHIKERKKSGNLPKLVLNRDPEFMKLPLYDQIDHKMREVMQRFDRKTIYGDSATDYTSSEESAIDLLSPKGRKLNGESSPNLKRESVTDEDTIHLKKMQMRGVKVKNEQVQNDIDFRCADCLQDLDHICFVCHKEVARSGSNIRQKCSLFACGKFYHPECLKIWPQTQWSFISTTKHKQSNKSLDTFICPAHVCHMCVSDDPRAAIPRCPSDKVVKCLRCPATYHNSAYCVPAGTMILSATQIICPRHLIPKRIVKKTLPIINTTWCFICSQGGDLICCETCPTSVHSECLEINLTEDDTFICEDCETGRFPLYDEIVWVKLGSYRWWPAVILFPNEVPVRVREFNHNKGDFVVRFFGTYDHYWVSRGRVFLFQDGDSGEGIASSSRKKVDGVFEKSIEEAAEAYRVKKEFKRTIVEENATKSKPPPYIKIKVNRPVGSVRQFDGNISNTTPCECDPKKEDPCSPDSDCLNRLLLTECNPEVCPAGENCLNQNFEKRSYPPLIPYRTESRGWGLKSLEPLKKGQFVIEYVGEMIDEQEYQRRIKKMHEQKEENYYFLTIDKDRMLDAGPKGNVARFMNHSCQPNCETQKWTVNGDTRVGLFAVIDVPANTELTFNYNLECVGKEKKICKCGAPNCSGFIGVKAKQEESHKKSKKLKIRKKKSSHILLPKVTNKDPCFVCGRTEDVSPCNNKICTKHYHLKCVNLDTWPDNKWVCPWHSCNICSKRTIRCCVKCINSYCPVHSEGNVRYDKLLGFVCSEHDPNKADLQEIKVDARMTKDSPTTMKITEENDVTSTTCDELDQNVICEPPKECEMSPRKISENAELVTSTPIKFAIVNDPIQGAPIAETIAPPTEVVTGVKRKRGRPRKCPLSVEEPNTKKIKLDKDTKRNRDEKLTLDNEVTLSSSGATARNLRTLKVVNYSVSEKLVAAQRRLDNDLPIRKRSSLRCEAVL